MFGGKSEAIVGKPVLVLEVAAEQGGVVGVEGDHEAGIKVAADGVVFEARAATGAQVGRDADFEWDLALGQEFHELVVVDGGEGVANAFRADVEGAPDAFGADGFSGMGGEAEAGVASFCVEVAEGLGAGAAFVAANADADDGWELGAELGGFAEDTRGFLRAEVANGVEDPVDGDAKLGFGPEACALHAGEEGLKLAVTPVIDDADRDIDFCVDDALAAQALQHAPGGQLVVFGGPQVFGNGFECLEEAGEVGVLKQCARLIDVEGDGIVEEAQFDQGFGRDGAFEMEVQLGFGESANVRGNIHDTNCSGYLKREAGRMQRVLNEHDSFCGCDFFVTRIVHLQLTDCQYNSGMAMLGVAEFRRALLAWFDTCARDLPWRQTRDPYAIWVSETMLQQTRVAVVVDYYTRFLKKFPDLASLAAGSEADVLAQWSGLGYYRRARALHESARAVVAEYGGVIPSTATGLARLPGVGVYTAAAVASIAFGEPVVAVDGNVERVLMRYMGLAPIAGSARSGQLRRDAADLVDPGRPGDFNQAMMELGATVCLPRGPQCLLCPVRAGCATQGVHASPQTKKMLSRKSTLALVQRRQWPKSEVLLERRPADASQMPEMWELPQLKEGKAMEDVLLLTLRHSITNTNYYVTVYGLNANEQKLLADGPGEREWVPSRSLLDRPLTGLTLKVLKRLKVMPGYSGAGPAVQIGELVPDARKEFDAALYGTE